MVAKSSFRVGVICVLWGLGACIVLLHSALQYAMPSSTVSTQAGKSAHLGNMKQHRQDFTGDDGVSAPSTKSQPLAAFDPIGNKMPLYMVSMISITMMVFGAATGAEATPPRIRMPALMGLMSKQSDARNEKMSFAAKGCAAAALGATFGMHSQKGASPTCEDDDAAVAPVSAAVSGWWNPEKGASQTGEVGGVAWQDEVALPFKDLLDLSKGVSDLSQGVTDLSKGVSQAIEDYEPGVPTDFGKPVTFALGSAWEATRTIEAGSPVAATSLWPNLEVLLEGRTMEDVAEEVTAWKPRIMNPRVDPANDVPVQSAPMTWASALAQSRLIVGEMCESRDSAGNWHTVKVLSRNFDGTYTCRPMDASGDISSVIKEFKLQCKCEEEKARCASELWATVQVSQCREFKPSENQLALKRREENVKRARQPTVARLLQEGVIGVAPTG